MKIIIFLTVLILVLPISIFGGEIDNIIKQQKKQQKETESSERYKQYKEREERQRCGDRIVSIVASKVKELVSRGVKFRYKPGVLVYQDYLGTRFALDFDGNTYRLLKSMYNERLLYLQIQEETIDLSLTLPVRNSIWIQPEGRDKTKVNIDITFYKDNSWEVEMFGHFTGKYTVKFMSYNMDEISTKRAEINKNLISAIEAAVKYGDK